MAESPGSPELASVGDEVETGNPIDEAGNEDEPLPGKGCHALGLFDGF
jgi:hypothetical protein